MEKLIGNIQFRRPLDNFQRTLQKGSKDIFALADKTKNIYKMERAQYGRLLCENSTKHYKAAEKDAYNKINQEARVIDSWVGIADKIDAMAKRKSFIVLKDY